MREEILKQLENIERDEKVRILLAVESGSRAWGFESLDSDYDVRFLYIKNTKEYLKIFEQYEVIETPIDELLDINGWDLKKGLKLLYKSNPPLMEWLCSPIVYSSNQEFLAEMKNLAEVYFSKTAAIYHHINLAKKSFEYIAGKERVSLKKFFYALRSVYTCMWVERNEGIPPMDIKSLMDGIAISEEKRLDVERLIKTKANISEKDLIEVSREFKDFLKGRIEYFNEYVKVQKEEREKDVSKLDDMFVNTLGKYGG